jgi:hypothetical protein
MRVPRILSGAFLVLLGVAAGVRDARGVVILTVTNTDDGGAGSFRQAILDSNASPGSDLIQFAIPGAGVHTIFALNALPPITESVLIDGYSQPGSVWNTDPYGDNAVLQIELLGNGTDGLVITGGATIVQGLALQGFVSAILLSGLSGNLIQGNFIGTDAAGNAGAGNTYGVRISGTSGLDRIGDNYPAARNLISNNSTGISVLASDTKIVKGNLIGTGPTGTLPLPNNTGVEIDSSISIYVGNEVADRNVISGNFAYGVSITNGSFNGVVNNYIGTDATGGIPLGNGIGVRVAGTSFGLTCWYNVISGSLGDGVVLDYTNNVGDFESSVNANVIGTNAAATVPIPNGGAGVRIESAGDLRVNGNIVAYNRVGIWRKSPTTTFKCELSNDPMWGNHGGLGIVLGPDPVIAANEPGGVYNFPIITSVTTAGANTHVEGYYSGPASTQVHLELFRAPVCSPGPQDFAQGRVLLGGYGAATDGNGYFSFSADYPAIGADETIVATATTTVTVPLAVGVSRDTLQTSPYSQRLPFSITPTSGTGAGSEPITIHGTNFDGAATVTIGGQPLGDLVPTSSQQFDGSSPALPAGAAYDVVVTNPGADPSTLRLAWVADFLDVFPGDAVHPFVVSLARAGITGGVGGGNYGVGLAVLRQQMAVFLLKAEHGVCYVPPPCQGAFTDVPCPSLFADWVEALAQEGITGGCGAGTFCPTNAVRRDQMAAFLLKTEHGASYVPPPCTGAFADVACPSLFADWVEQLAMEGVTAGCGGGNYCPLSSNTRGQMAVFLQKTFNLPLSP